VNNYTVLYVKLNPVSRFDFILYCCTITGGPIELLGPPLKIWGAGPTPWSTPLLEKMILSVYFCWRWYENWKLAANKALLSMLNS